MSKVSRGLAKAPGFFENNSDMTTRAPWKHKLRAVNATKRTALCAACGPVHVTKRGKPNVGWRCGKAFPHSSGPDSYTEKARKAGLLGESCEFCGVKSPLVADHDHATGDYRGTLCCLCNTALAKLGDSRAGIARVLEYLQKPQKPFKVEA